MIVFQMESNEYPSTINFDPKVQISTEKEQQQNQLSDVAHENENSLVISQGMLSKSIVIHIV